MDVKKAFQVTVPFIERSSRDGYYVYTFLCDMHFIGTGFYDSTLPKLERIAYELDAVYSDGTNITNQVRALVGEPSEINRIHEAIMAHLEKQFAPDGYLP